MFSFIARVRFALAGLFRERCPDCLGTTCWCDPPEEYWAARERAQAVRAAEVRGALPPTAREMMRDILSEDGWGSPQALASEPLFSGQPAFWNREFGSFEGCVRCGTEDSGRFGAHSAALCVDCDDIPF